MLIQMASRAACCPTPAGSGSGTARGHTLVTVIDIVSDLVSLVFVSVTIISTNTPFSDRFKTLPWLCQCLKGTYGYVESTSSGDMHTQNMKMIF